MVLEPFVCDYFLLICILVEKVKNGNVSLHNKSIDCIDCTPQYFAVVTGSNPVEALFFSGFFFPIAYIENLLG